MGQIFANSSSFDLFAVNVSPDFVGDVSSDSSSNISLDFASVVSRDSADNVISVSVLAEEISLLASMVPVTMI